MFGRDVPVYRREFNTAGKTQRFFERTKFGFASTCSEFERNRAGIQPAPRSQPISDLRLELQITRTTQEFDPRR